MDYEQDYILRLIQRVGQFFREIVAALREHRPKDALRFSEEALHHITGLSPKSAETLPPETLLALLSAGGYLDVRRCLMLAETFRLRSRAYASSGQATRAAAERAKARTLATAALDAADGDDIERARSLLVGIEKDADSPSAGTLEGDAI